MRDRVLLLILSILLASCAAKLPYTSNIPLTRQIFHSRDGVLGGRIPQGWFSSTEDTLAPAVLVWLIKEDFSATLTLKELIPDQLAKQQINKEGLMLLAEVSSKFQTESFSELVNTFQEFNIRGRKFCSYEVGAGSERKRLVVFAAGGKYYECEMRTMKGIWTATELTHLFNTQQTVLSSLTY